MHCIYNKSKIIAYTWLYLSGLYAELRFVFSAAIVFQGANIWSPYYSTFLTITQLVSYILRNFSSYYLLMNWSYCSLLFTLITLFNFYTTRFLSNFYQRSYDWILSLIFLSNNKCNFLVQHPWKTLLHILQESHDRSTGNYL